MTDQIIDKKTVAIPGPMGDVTPAALAAKNAAAASASAAANSAADAASSKTAAAASAAAAAAAPATDANVASLVLDGSATREAVRGVAALSAAGTGPVVVAYFLTGDERAHFAVSPDGVSFYDTAAVFAAASPGTVRDPSICMFNGRYYMTFTRSTDGTGNGGNTIGVAHSSDLKTWVEHTPITMPSSITNAWAPDFFVDDGVVHIIVSMRNGAAAAFQTYELHNTNSELTAWSTPVALTGFPAAVIDANIVKLADGTYSALVSNNAGGYIQRVKASALTGPWAAVNSGDPYGLGPSVEAPATVAKVDGGWRVYVDHFGNTDDVRYVDFNSDFTQWTEQRAIALPMRHIGVMASSSLAGLKSASSSVASMDIVTLVSAQKTAPKATISTAAALSVVPDQTTNASLLADNGVGSVKIATAGIYALTLSVKAPLFGSNNSRQFLQLNSGGVPFIRTSGGWEDEYAVTGIGYFGAGSDLTPQYYNETADRPFTVTLRATLLSTGAHI